MTREELWKIYTDRNPQFLVEGGQVTMSTTGLKRLFDQTWDQATQAAEAKKPVPSPTAGDDLYERLFGGGFGKPPRR